MLTLISFSPCLYSILAQINLCLLQVKFAGNAALPDWTAIINISGSRRVMTGFSETTVHKYSKNFKVTEERCLHKRLKAFINSVSCLLLQTDCENSLPFAAQLPVYPPFRQVKMAQSWITADRKPKSAQVKTYEVWLAQWVSSSPSYSALGEWRDIQKRLSENRSTAFSCPRRWSFVQTLLCETLLLTQFRATD